MTTTGGSKQISHVRKLVGGGIAAVAAVTGLFAANASPAFAASYWETQTDGATGVSAWGTSSSSGGRCDIGMHIKDTSADGHRAGVQVYWNDINDMSDGRSYYRYNTAGSDTTVDRSVWDLLDYSDVEVYVREFVSEGAIESGGSYVDRGDWVSVC